MRILHFFILLSLSLNSLFAQDCFISGTIQDASDKQTITGARIFNVATGQVVVSDNQGFYRIKIQHKSNIMLQIKSLGYEKCNINLSFVRAQDTTINILLSPESEDIKTIVVTATRTEKKLKDVPVLTQVISANKLLNSGITTVSQALEKEIPGLDFASFSYLPKVTFQGMNSKYVLFLMDGERLAGEMDGNVDYSRLNMANVDRIEVVRGASSTLYGSSAIGGVVNVITKPQIAKYEVDANVRYSKFNDISSSLSSGFKWKQLSSRTSVVYNQTDGFSLTHDPYNMSQDKSKNGSVNQRFEFRPSDKLTFTVNGNSYYKRIYNGAITHVDNEYFDVDGYLKANYQFDSIKNLLATYSADDYFSYSAISGTNERTKVSYDFLQNAKLIGNCGSSWGLWTTGLEVLHEDLYSERVTGSYKKSTELIGFLQSDYKISHNFSMVAGVRATHHNVYGLNISPKISAMLQLNPFIIRASYGNGFRSPSLKELYMEFQHSVASSSFVILGNEDLKPEESQYYGLSAELLKRTYSFTVNLYHNKVRNMIYAPLKEASVYQYTNITNAKTWGLDLMGRYSPVKNLTFTSGIGLVDSRDDSTKRIKGISPISANVGVSYSATIFKQACNFDLFGKYIGDRSYEPVNGIDCNDDAYQTWRFTYTQHIKDCLTLSLAVDNILDQTDPGSFDNITPGRRFFITLSYRFAKY
jgi:outer membrane receptor for ferrienterochelin and colicins